MSVAGVTDEQRERLARMVERFNASLLWQLEHAKAEADRERLRGLFGPATGRH
ncbi:hypothetical protein I5H01_gp016 [Mycobacterium phage MarkPhew]|uniref:Uncharacterized protein n=1 Tax=Mycobacterium phage MarkPhew TaxID=2725625 RepID=A0A6M3T8P1_9CAUD|nr:hypothetical protein I5H01_gp016 [Mycobacterium phage MarkPhew]QJD50391.1 hypothetical protein SEA_MARKPHEW_91 [Mycobacterium phage MarkPhew]